MNKAALKRLALELRAEVGLDAFAPFDPYGLAAAYGIEVHQLSSVGCSDAALRHFRDVRPDVFSGALVPVGCGAVILENDFHDAERRRATAAHEMAHVALEHPFTASFVDERGCRAANGEHEQEATELGGELLLPFEAAKRLAWRHVSDEEAARAYGVSVAVARWRLNATGARLIVERAERRRGA